MRKLNALLLQTQADECIGFAEDFSEDGGGVLLGHAPIDAYPAAAVDDLTSLPAFEAAPLASASLRRVRRMVGGVALAGAPKAERQRNRAFGRASMSARPGESNLRPRSQSPYSLLTGTSVMLGSILRYPPLSMIHGCSRYGGSSSAAVLGSKMGCRTSNAALPSFVGRSSLVIREYAFMRPLPSRGSFASGWGVGLGELGRCDFPHI